MNKKLLATALLGLGLFPSLLFGQYYRMDIDLQNPGENRVIDRVFTGNTVGLDVGLFDGDVPFSATNWTVWFKYGDGQYATNDMQAIAGVTSSNRVVFNAVSNVFYSPNENYYFSIFGTNGAGRRATFARGRLIEEYDPAASEGIGTSSNGIYYHAVSWEIITGDPADNAALVQYVEDHGGGSAEDSVARAGVVSNAADIAVMQTGKLDVATAEAAAGQIATNVVGAALASLAISPDASVPMVSKTFVPGGAPAWIFDTNGVSRLGRNNGTTIDFEHKSISGAWLLNGNWKWYYQSYLTFYNNQFSPTAIYGWEGATVPQLTLGGETRTNWPAEGGTGTSVTNSSGAAITLASTTLSTADTEVATSGAIRRYGDANWGGTGTGWTNLAFSGTGNAITGATAAADTLTLQRGEIEGGTGTSVTNSSGAAITLASTTMTNTDSVVLTAKAVQDYGDANWGGGGGTVADTTAVTAPYFIPSSTNIVLSTSYWWQAVYLETNTTFSLPASPTNQATFFRLDAVCGTHTITWGAGFPTNHVAGNTNSGVASSWDLQSDPFSTNYTSIRRK